MKRVGILTFHYCFNPGAMLQAYALLKYISNKGFTVEFINYQMRVLKDRYKSLKPLKDALRTPRSFLHPKGILKQLIFSFTRTYKYSSFREKYLRESKNSSCLNYDKIIVGSDQVWNKSITKTLDNYYWGIFISSPGCKLYSYAASASHIDVEDEDFIKRHLSRFSKISVREDNLSKRLGQLGIKSEVVLDPVFLLDKGEWLKLVDVANGRYICTYNILGVRLANELADYLSRNMNLSIVSCLQKPNNFAISPTELISNIYNSELVITTSFHGLAFSIILQKNFWVVNVDDSRKERMVSLLHLLGLDDRIVYDMNKDFNYLEEIDWVGVNERLAEQKKIAKKYLDSILYD